MWILSVWTCGEFKANLNGRCIPAFTARPLTDSLLADISCCCVAWPDTPSGTDIHVRTDHLRVHESSNLLVSNIRWKSNGLATLHAWAVSHWMSCFSLWRPCYQVRAATLPVPRVSRAALRESRGFVYFLHVLQGQQNRHWHGLSPHFQCLSVEYDTNMNIWNTSCTCFKVKAL